MNTTPPSLVDPVAFYTAEMLAIHGMADEAQVPKTINGAPLSASQRVAILVGVFQAITERFPGAAQAITTRLEQRARGG